MLSGLAIEFAVTRTLRDAAALLDAVHGPGTGDKYEIASPARPYAEEVGTPPGQLRIALTTRAWSRRSPGQAADHKWWLHANSQMCTSIGLLAPVNGEQSDGICLRKTA